MGQDEVHLVEHHDPQPGEGVRQPADVPQVGHQLVRHRHQHVWPRRGGRQLQRLGGSAEKGWATVDAEDCAPVPIPGRDINAGLGMGPMGPVVMRMKVISRSPPPGETCENCHFFRRQGKELAPFLVSVV